MPLLKTQSIPPELAEFYKQALGETRPNTNPGGGDPDLTEIAQGRYPEHIEPPHEATFKQLRQREYFQDCFTCFNAAPENERRAYWRLSRDTSLRYYNLYMQRNIPLRMIGQSCGQWGRPHALSLKSELNFNHGGVYVPVEYEDAGGGVIELETDATPVGSNPYWCSEGPFSIFDFHIDRGSPPYDWECEILHTWNPTQRIRVETDFEWDELPPPVWEWERYIFFWRNGLLYNETVVWDLDVEVATGNPVGWGFD